MAIDIIMPKLGLTMSEGTIIKWRKSEGEYIEKGDVILELESDKSVYEDTAKQSGYLLKTYYSEGDVVPILTRIAVMGEKGEQIEDRAGGLAEEQAEEKEEKIEEKAEEQTVEQADKQAEEKNGARIIASPLARKMAKQYGVDLSNVVAIDGKRIEVRDVQEAIDNKAASPIQTQRTRIAPMNGMRKTIAKRMHGSLQTNAQTTLKAVLDMSEAQGLMGRFTERGYKISYNDIVAYATCKALIEFPYVNAELAGDSIIEKDFVNLGIAVALDTGLIVPVLHDADRLSLIEISSLIREKSNAAREGALSFADCTGGSFTISNLGMYGLDEFVAIINPPEAAILAVGAVREAPAVVDGALCVRPLMTLTLSYDHRIIDGAPAAQFIMRLKEMIEDVSAYVSEEEGGVQNNA